MRAATPAPAGQLTAQDLENAMMNLAGGSGAPRLSLRSVVSADDVLATGILDDVEVSSTFTRGRGAPPPVTVASLQSMLHLRAGLSCLDAATTGLTTD